MALWAWGAGVSDLLNVAPAQVPMAPATAILIVLVALVLLLQQSRRPAALFVHRLALGIAALTAAVGFFALLRPAFDWNSPFEEWLSQTRDRIGEIPLGQMSPLTGAAFLALAASIIFRQPALMRRPWTGLASRLLAGGVLFWCAGVICGYAIGHPWLHGGTTIPMALSTAIAMSLLATSLSLLPWRPESELPPDHRPHLWTHVAVASSLAVMIAALGALYMRHDQTNRRLDAQETLKSVGQLKATQIAEWRRERFADGQFMARIPAFTKAVDAFIARDSVKAGGAEVARWLRHIKSGHRYEKVALFDDTGTLLLSIEDSFEPPLALEPDLAADASAPDRIVMTSVRRDPGAPSPHIDIAFPLSAPDSTPNRALATILFRVNPDQHLFPIVREWPTPSQTAETLLVERQDGRAVFFSDPHHANDANLTSADLASNPTLPTAMAALGRTGIVEGTDLRGAAVLASIHPIPDSPWILIVKMHRDEIFAHVRERAWLVLGITIAVASVSGLIVRLGWRTRELLLLRQNLSSERERAALAQRVEHLMKGANDIIFLVDEKGRILEPNDRAIESYGYSREKLCGMSLRDLRAPEERARFPAQAAQLAGDGSARFETVHMSKDGRTFPVEASHRLVDVGGQRLDLAIIRDISQRKAHEAQITRLTRLYETLSQINQTIVRIRSREELFREVCRIAAEYAGFHLVWVGIVDPATARVVPVARAGSACDYLDSIAVFSDTRPEGLGPAGTCIREGSPCIIRDFLADPRTAPWHAPARARGLRSCASFPIRVDGAVIGALTVYSTDPDFFQDREVELLMETAIDISFALDLLHNDDRRRQAEAERAVTVRLLEAVNRHDDMEGLIRAATLLLRDEFGLDAVGVRLRHGDDFPYFETVGFPPDFVRAESTLCIRDPQGQPQRDTEGKPLLACMCGNVLAGRFDPSQPFFSPRGSFWTNSTSDLLATTTEADRLTQTRNRCHDQGYESVALVALRHGNETLGLLQFNDRRTARFGPQRISLFERLADHLAIAIAHRNDRARLREGQEQLARIAATVPGTIFSFLVRPDGSMAMPFATESLHEIYGIRPEDVRTDATSALAKIHPDHIGRVMASIREAVQTLQPWRQEFIVRGTRDGDIWVEGHTVLHREPNGDTMAYGFLWDVTARKRAEIALQGSRAELSAIYHHAPIMMCLIDEDGRIAQLNEAARRFAGLHDGVEIGMRGGDLIGCLGALDDPRGCGYGPKCARCTMRQVVMDTLATGKAHIRVETEPAIVRGNRASDISLAVSTARITVDGKHRVLLCIEDETARKKAERELRQSEHRFRALVENAPAGIFVQTEGRFAYLNRYATAMFGAASPTDLIGQPVIDRVHPEFRARVQERIRTVRDERQPVPIMEETYCRLDGSTLDVEVSAVPMEFGGMAAALVFCRDIADRKRLEAQLFHAQRMEAVGRLAGGISHDLNNILTVTMMNVSLLREMAAGQPEFEETLEDIDAVTRRASDLTRQLLLFSRRSVIQARSLSPNELISNLLKMLKRLTREHIDLQYLPGQDLPLIRGDIGMLEQVVTNIVVNAQDAMPSGGRLTITSDLADIPAAQRPTSPDARPGRFVRISIADTGCGMDDPTLAKIFEPFFTTKEPGKGTGLGLATAYGIVKQHGGWITVESAPSRGSTFRIFLPAAAAPESEFPRAHTRAPIPKGGDETILLVEDESSVRRSLSAFLRRQGYRVVEAENATRALDVWKSHAHGVDLLLSDMVMPGQMNGLELARCLREEAPDLPVIISSGYSEVLARQQGPTDVAYAPKPCAPHELAALIRRCLDQAPGSESASDNTREKSS